MIPLFVIFLREGIEAAMIVAVLLAYLRQIGRRDHFADIYLGVAVALALASVFGVIGYVALTRYSGSPVQTYFETSTYIIAIGALTAMTLWMQRHSRSLTAQLQRRSDQALTSRQRFGLSIVAFQAVGREGVETMVFTLAILFSNAHQGAAPSTRGALVGAFLGLLVALGVAVAIYRLGARLNMGRFFRILGVVLLVFAAGLVADTVENLQQLGWLPLGSRVLWNSSGFVRESSNLGDVLHSLVGYADQPTLSQLLLWVLYLAGVLLAFRLASRPRVTH
ncbi:MAG: iron transporter [Acidimicrobiaceae bacterium]|nr:iron transporter [Acidimicrobiaceae bacterium]